MIEDKLRSIAVSVSIFNVYLKNIKKNTSIPLFQSKVDHLSLLIENFTKGIKKQVTFIERDRYTVKLSHSMDKEFQFMLKESIKIGNTFYEISQEIKNTKFMKYDSALEDVYNEFVVIYENLKELYSIYKSF